MTLPRPGTLVRLLAAVLLLAPATALPALAAGPAPLHRVHRSYSFDGPGTGVLVLQGRVRADRRGGLYAQVAGDALRTGGRPFDVYFPQVTDLGGDPLETYGRLGRRDLCLDPVTTCTVQPDGAMTFTSVFLVTGDETTESHVRFHLVLQGVEASVKETLIGWKGAPGGAVRQVTDATADGAGARTPVGAVGLLLSAASTGGARGSIGIGLPPCTAAGAGAVVLSGPGVTRPAVCPTSAVAAVAGRGGRWTLSGPAAGVAEGRSRLLVLDL